MTLDVRYWLLTNTCYGQWLPGEARGFVGQVTDHRAGDEDKPRVRHNLHGTEYDAAIRGLHERAQALLKCHPILLSTNQAEALLAQFRETAGVRKWSILAVAVMANHFHMVVAAPGDVDSGKVLGDFKSWGTRALSARFGAPASGTWWTERGSKRLLPDEAAIERAVRYVRLKQPNPLVVWPPIRDEELASVEP